MPKSVLTFAIYHGGQMVGRESVSHDIVKVGRDPKSHLRVADEAASRMHAVIEVASPAEITLIDLGNERGTYVNGARINRSRLVLGDRIDVGSTQLVLENIEALEAQAPPLPLAPAPAQVAARPAPAQRAPTPLAGLPGSGPAASPPTRPSARPMPAAAAASAPAPGGRSARVGAVAVPVVGSAAHALSAPPASPAVTAAPALAPRVSDDPEAYTYALIKSGPEVPAEEVELAHAQAAEVIVLWGSNVLHVAHLAPPRNFYVGEEQGKQAGCDFFIPQAKLGVARMPVVVADASGIAVVLPPGANGEIQTADGQLTPLDQARARAKPCAELPGAQQLPLEPGSKARVQVSDLVFQVAAVNAGKPLPHGLAGGLDWTALAYFGMSLLTIGGFVAAMAFFVPPLGLSADEGIDQDQLYLIQQYLDAAAEREQEREESEAEENQSQEGGTGERAAGEEGQMGKESSTDTNKRYAVRGPEDNPDPHLARQAALRDAMEFGIIGLLNSGAAGDPDAPVSPFGRDTSLGTDALSANGNMWGDDIGNAFGTGGLGLTGTGLSGGGQGVGVGLGTIGTIGHGSGTGSGQGYGSGHGRMGGAHRTRTPKLRRGKTEVSGRLPKAVIQRIIRQNYGRFRLCYQEGLGRNPNLEGRVSVRFVIGSNGAVSNVMNGGSDLPDSSVVQCVVRAFYGLSFPKPEGGIVRVTYPIMLSPG